MGMWEDVVAANIRARDRQDADNLAQGRRANVCGHYSSWLQYGHLMLEQVDEAGSLMDRCHARMAEEPTAEEQGYFISMRARQILDTEDWSLASRWTWTPPASTSPADSRRQFNYDWVNAFAALRRGDPAPARRLAALTTSDDQTRIAGDELRGLLAIAAGRADEGLRTLEAAAAAEGALPFEFGPPRIVKPTSELLGEELLKLGRIEQARAAFDLAAARTPGRASVRRGIESAARH